MSKNTTSGLSPLFDNYLLSSFISLILLVAGIATASVSLMIASGIVAYGWPFLYVYLTHHKDNPETVEKAHAKPLNVARPTAAGAH
jgi:hypothetical protein